MSAAAPPCQRCFAAAATLPPDADCRHQFSLSAEIVLAIAADIV